jgi:ketosteroid isomerase-like protein
VPHADLLRRNYALLGERGGIEEIAKTLHPDHELRDPTVGGPPTVYRGRDGFLDWARRGMTTFADTTMTPVDFEERGDIVLVTLRVRATGTMSGEPVDLDVHNVVEMRDGLVWRTSGYIDAAEARRAAGFD